MEANDNFSSPRVGVKSSWIGFFVVWMFFSVIASFPATIAAAFVAIDVLELEFESGHGSGVALILLSSMFGFLGALIGDVLRKFARPEVFFSRGFFEIIWTKLFWLIGPQFIGLGVGAFIGALLYLIWGAK